MTKEQLLQFGHDIEMHIHDIGFLAYLYDVEVNDESAFFIFDIPACGIFAMDLYLDKIEKCDPYDIACQFVALITKKNINYSLN